MMRRLVRAVIRNATVTRADGLTLRLDPVLLRAANILPLEEVEIVHHATGQRFVTFAEEGVGVCAPKMREGDVISIVAYGILHDGQTLAHTATIVTLAEDNEVIGVAQSSAVPA
ncbi:MAG TPA: aspartate 1-decarboxylase [Thermoanaerobaculia bacterium]|nr:aspartate 1-decarboxylase [Thermoanaerobaculia bacterium]